MGPDGNAAGPAHEGSDCSPSRGAAEQLEQPATSTLPASNQQGYDGGSPAGHSTRSQHGEQQEPQPMQLDVVGGRHQQHPGEVVMEEGPQAASQLSDTSAQAEAASQEEQLQQEHQHPLPQQQGSPQPATSPGDAEQGEGSPAHMAVDSNGAADHSPKHHEQQQSQQDEQHQQQHQHTAPSDEPSKAQPGAEGDVEAAHAAVLEQQQTALEQQQKLNELEAVLRQPDAVMEPAIMDKLREYVMANGHPQAAVEYLTDSYVGYAQMASLVCRWLESTDEQDSSTARGGPAAVVANGAAAAASARMEADVTTGGSRQQQQQGQQQGRKLDEAFYLRQLAKERFDPQLFATVFTKGGSGAPQWLNGLIAEREGRSLVYELAGRYKNSLLLNFAIHKILMQPGREKEVAAVGGSLAGYFGVFHRLMAAKLREAAAASDEASLAALTRGLKEDCCASQHTYVHVQQVLTELAKHPRGGARFRRISQELEEHAAALHGPVVWKMRQWFAEPGQPEQHYQVAALLSDVLASSVSGVPPASEMIKLYRLYFPQGQEQQPPPISFLRHPRVFEVLLQGLFSPGRQLQPELLQAYSGLLALAAAADDRRPAGTAAHSPNDAAATATTGVSGGAGGSAGAGGQAGLGVAATGSSEAGFASSLSAAAAGEALDLSAVPATRAALEGAAELAQRVMQDQKGSQEDMQRAAAVLEYPCCAAGLLRALGAQLTRPDYWQTAYHLQKSPPFLSLLSLLVPRQPALHDSLLQLLGRALGALGNTNHDMAKGFLSIAVQLVSAGRVFEVLRWAGEWKQRADPSLVRHLVFGILEVAAPPYSPDFAGSMLRIMMAAGIRRQRLSARDWAVKALLDEFAAACAQVQFKPPLSSREAQFLQDISVDRPPGY